MRKIVFLLIIFAFCSSQLKAQHQEITENRSGNYEDVKNVYIGLGTGINSITALMGVSLNVRIYDKFFLRGAAGLGSWGTKLSAGIRYDLNYDRGWFFAGTFSTCSGVNKVLLEMELSNGNMQKLEIDYLRANVLNLSIGHNWKLGRSNNFYLEFGYAIPLSSHPWRIRDNVTLSDASKFALRVVQPGGLLIGLGFTFGL